MCHVKGWSWSVSIISPVSTDQCLQSHDHDTCVWWILLPQSHVTISVTDHAYHWPITAQLCSTWHCVNQSEPSIESRDLFSTNQSWDGVCCSGSDTWYSVMRQLCLQWPKFNNIDTRWWHQGHSGHGNILMIFGTKYSTCFSDFYKKQKSYSYVRLYFQKNRYWNFQMWVFDHIFIFWRFCPKICCPYTYFISKKISMENMENLINFYWKPSLNKFVLHSIEYNYESMSLWIINKC